MAEYISREDIIEKLEEEIQVEWHLEDVWINKGLEIALKDIKSQPAEDVQPVKRGRWIEVTPKHSRCSVCDTTCLIAVYPISKGAYFCPNCGARMGENNVSQDRCSNYMDCDGNCFIDDTPCDCGGDTNKCKGR